MKKTFFEQMKLVSFVVIMAIAGASCSKKDDKEPETTTLPVVTRTINVDGTGSLSEPVTRYYNLETGGEIPAANATGASWDIAFRRTVIMINSGVSGGGKVVGQYVNKEYSMVTEAPENGYLKDGDASYSSIDGSSEKLVFANWFDYDTETHSAYPVPASTYVLKTNGGKYLKLRILSYEQGRYSFMYTLQPGGSRDLAD